MAKVLITTMSRRLAPLRQTTRQLQPQPSSFSRSIYFRFTSISKGPRFAKFHSTSSSKCSSIATSEAATASQETQKQQEEVKQDTVNFTAPHVPVLMEEIMEFFQDINVRVYVDGTLGAGGHASQVVARHLELETLVGFDLDPLAHKLAKERLTEHGAHVIHVNVDPKNGIPTLMNENKESNFGGGGGGDDKRKNPPAALLVRSNFSAMGSVLPHLSNHNNTNNTSTPIHGHVDAILLDLGISSMQVDLSERGFSFMRDGPLDMRMDPEALISAELAVNTWSEAQLGKIIKEYGEERYWKSIARRITSAREEEPILTTHQLVKAIGNPGGGGFGGGKGGKGKGGGKGIHPATRTFQALRIAVNGELQSIAEAIPAAVKALAPGGRLAVITFHSLEDRIVKWAFRQAAGMAPTDEPLPSYCVPFDEKMRGEAMVKILTRKPVVPKEEEEKENPRSRSAKLRIVERI